MKKGIFIIVLLILFLGTGLTAYVFLSESQGTPPAETTRVNAVTQGINILGSEDYVSKIQEIAKQKSPRVAFSVIMADVKRLGTQLDTGTTENIGRFHKLVSNIVYQIGDVDQEMHYFRNKLNRAPKTLTEMIKINQSLPKDKRWTLYGIPSSEYHLQGVNGEYNLKFVSWDGYCEAVYNKAGVLQTDKNNPIDMGTYNYAAGIAAPNAHNRFDVIPYLKWGNTPDAKQRGKTEIIAAVKAAMDNYKKNALGVYKYRQGLFGMQSGKVN